MNGLKLRNAGVWFSAATLLLLAASPVGAAPPWTRLSLFRQVECDPNKDYPLTEDAGPWLIMALTFSGDDAEEQAKDLVLTIRREMGLPAFTHHVEFNHGEDIEATRTNRYGGRQRYRYRIDDIEEIAVLVGNFPSVDDPEAQRMLERIKHENFECLQFDRITAEGETVSRPLAALRAEFSTWLPSNSPKRAKGPMGHAFIISNPLIPQEYFVPRGIDRMLVDLNKPLRYSLLNCPGRYTVQVATFKGMTTMNQELIQQFENGKPLPNQLEQAAFRAHRLCEALRLKGYEAYEFHDRASSIVCVGSFESVGTTLPDGRIDLDPRILDIMTRYKARETLLPGQSQPTYTMQTLIGIPFDIQPMPVEVPRPSVVVDYSRHLGEN